MAKQFMRVADIATTKGRPGLLPVSAATIWRWAADPNSDFPKPIRITDGLTVWDRESVEAFIEKRAALSLA
ncbi:hypothetical protein VLK31_02800 [Variovorax sp. H27-G14]|uniref:helix-turn-helix transcriptional regulator n=1 Tax=Variovorax sp. H27-G14 TaxID=3111914 RepID=UPI0038FC704C